MKSHRLPSLPGFLGCLLIALFLAAPGRAGAQDLKITAEQLAAWLKQYPQADTNHDGVLTEAEARAYYAAMQAAASAGTPAPTFADVAYGSSDRDVLDLWQAPGDRPAPLVIYIHGGGFVTGGKEAVRSLHLVRQCLDAGVSIASISYPYLSAKVSLPEVLHHCARAVQFLRAHAAEYHIDPARVAACGHSAGAGTSLWLAFHDDMADPANADPVLRESTRLACAVAWDGQYTYDLPAWAARFGEDNFQRFAGIYKSPAIYGVATVADLDSPVGRQRRAECDYYAMISPDDPPVYLGSGLPTTDIRDVNEYLHNPRHAELVYERCRAEHVTAVAKIPALKILPGPNDPPYGEPFMFKYLRATESPAPAGRSK